MALPARMRLMASPRADRLRAVREVSAGARGRL